MSTLLQDLRFAARMLLKNQAFTTTALVTLALGLGLNTAIFGMVNAVLFKAPPYDNADRLVLVHRPPLNERRAHAFSYPDYCEYPDNSDVLDELATCHQMQVSVGLGAATRLRPARLVAGNYFAMLGADAAVGRLLNEIDDHTPGGHPGFGLCGALALLRASIGLHGVISYAVSQRTREIGVRMALGARRGDVLRVVLKQGLKLTGTGLGIGVVLAPAGSFALSSVLYGVGAGDPISFVGVSVFLPAIAPLAC